jgi:plastocyanin
MVHRLILTFVCTLALAGCGSDSSSPTSPSSSNPSRNQGNAIIIGSGVSGATSAAFGSNPLTIAAGTTLTWQNEDNVAHTATSNTNVWNSGTINPGGSFSFTFTQAGNFPYRCTVHPNMVGTVIVQ